MPFNDGIQRQGPFGLLGARVEYGPSHRRWTVAAFGRNLNNADCRPVCLSAQRTPLFLRTIRCRSTYGRQRRQEGQGKEPAAAGEETSAKGQGADGQGAAGDSPDAGAANGTIGWLD